MVWVDVEPWVAMSEPTSVLATPLQVTDPPKVGDFWLDARLTASPAGVAYLGHGRDNAPVMLVLLSDGAATDANARHRLAGEVNKMHVDTVVARGGQGQDDGRMGDRHRSEDDDPVGPDEAPMAPWVALAWDGSRAAVAEADRLLAQIDLSTTAQLGSVKGPEYKLHWLDNTEPGVTRLWPLPWPGRHDRAGWVTMAVSWLLMIALSALALLIAVLMDRLTKSTLVRGLVLTPYLVSNVVVAMVFLWILDAQLGIGNQFLAWLGVDPIGFFTEEKWVIPTIALVNVWRHMGYTALLIFAGLQTIPQTAYEAAKVDGASEWKTFWRITLPLLRPILALVLIMTVIGSFQVFDTVAVTTAGGPVNSSRVLQHYIYTMAFGRFQFGYASALSVALLVLLMVITVIQYRLTRAGETDLN